MTNRDNKGGKFRIETCKYCTDYKGQPKPILPEDMPRAIRMPDGSYKCEYEGQYIGKVGGVFSIHSIDRATATGAKYEAMVSDPNQWLQDVPTVMALDPAWGSTSKYGVVILQFIDQKIVTLYATEYSKPDMGCSWGNTINEFYGTPRKGNDSI